jgi:membrane fusion protein (multidrug efflux system)
MNKAVSETELKAGAVLVKPRASWRRLALAGIGLCAVAGAAVYGKYWWETGRWIESTDDAYIGGDTTPLSPRVSSHVAEILVQDNQRVSAGQLLIRLDDRTYRASLDRAEATVRQEQATLQNLHARRELQLSTIEQAQADVTAKEAAAVFAQQEVRRYQALAATSAGSEQNAQKAVAGDQQARAQTGGAQAALAAAKQQITVIDTEIGQAQAALESAEADRETARLNLGYTEIRSPIDGFIGNRAAQVGAFVSQGTYLLTVVPAHRLWIDANFKEDQLERMRIGQPATVTADVAPDQPLHGHIESLAPATGAVFSVIPPENATGNFTKIVQRVPVRVMLDEDSARLVALRPGLSTEVSVDTKVQ